MADSEGSEGHEGDDGALFKVGEWNELIGEDIQLKITEAGAGQIPNVGQLVRCKYTGRLLKTGEVFEKMEDTGYRIGDNDTTPGLELGLRHMRKGEKGLIRATAKYAFGPFGRKNVGYAGEVEVPPDADIEYEVEVTEVYPPFNPKEAPSEARLVEATLKKQLGNNFFHHEDWTRAIRCYQSAVKSLDPAEVDVEEEGEQVLRDVTKVYCDISNNLAMALMKLDRHKEACEVCVKVIEVDPYNVKALYRGGVASMMQDKYEEAELALKEAYKLAPTDGQVIKALKELARLKAEYAAKEKKMYKAMGGFLNKRRPSRDEDGKEEEEEGGGDKGAAAGAKGAAAGAKGAEGTEGEGDKGQQEEDEESDQEEDDEGEEDEEDEEVEEEEEEEGGVAAAKSAAAAETQKGPWVMRHFDVVVTVVMLVLPVIFVWPDLAKFWRRRLGWDEAAGGEEL